MLARAELGRARGDRDTQPWQAAAERFSALGRAYHAAYALMRAGDAGALAGAPAREVAEALRGAHSAAVELAVRPFRTEVEELARRTRVALDVPTGPGRGVAEELGLTEREIDVLTLVAERRSNREIAQELFITSKTAGAHVSTS